MGDVITPWLSVVFTECFKWEVLHCILDERPSEKVTALGGMLCHIQCTSTLTCTHIVIQYIDPHAQRHPEQTFSGLIWLKGLWIFAEKSSFFSAPHFVSSSWEVIVCKNVPLIWVIAANLYPFPMLRLKIECSWPLAFEILLSLYSSPKLSSFHPVAQRLSPRG